MYIRVNLGHRRSQICITACALWLLLATASGAVAMEAGVQTQVASPSRFYALNLHSQSAPINAVEDFAEEPFKSYRQYQTQGIVQGKVWHRLRLGFFSSLRAAKAVKQQVADIYPNAWIVKVATDEWRAHREAPADPGPATVATTDASPVAMQTVVAPQPHMSGLQSPLLAPEIAIRDAYQAILEANYGTASTLLGTLLAQPGQASNQRALELFGQALEYSSEGPKQARIEYEKYLQRYPWGAGSDRVRKRLAALTAAPQPSKKPVEVKQTGAVKKAAAMAGWSLGASISNVSYSDGPEQRSFEGYSANLTSKSSIDDDGGWKIFAQYRFNPYFALETSYIDLGRLDLRAESGGGDESDFVAGPVSLTGNINGLAVAGLVIFPINEQLELMTKLGLYHWDMNQTVEDAASPFVSEMVSGESTLIGVGLNYHRGHWSIRAELEHFDRVARDIEVSQLSLGLQYRFNATR